MGRHSEVFVGLTAAKVKNAVAIAEGERNGEVLYLGKIESTSEPTRRSSYRFLYETLYCQRGQMENRLNECQGDMFADRTPAPTTCANQLRQQLASFPYVLMCGAPYRPCRHEARSDHMRHHPAKAPQDRCSRHHQRQAREACARVRLPDCRDVDRACC
jgi:hypothetical protein